METPAAEVFWLKLKLLIVCNMLVFFPFLFESFIFLLYHSYNSGTWILFVDAVALFLLSDQYHKQRKKTESS